MERVLNAVSHFEVTIDPVSCKSFGNGHINDTFLFSDAEHKNKYIIQAINTNIFKNPEGIMDNIRMVSEHIKTKLGNTQKIMEFIPNKNGKYFHESDDHSFWRIYRFVEGICLDFTVSAKDFYECGYAFGEFQKFLCDFNADSLHKTIPNFHNTPLRFHTFLEAVEKDVCGRTALVKEEIDFICNRQEFYSVLFENHKSGNLPLRVTHNDTKSNNVLLNPVTRKALCVIDLDTIMPGFSVNDFGDAIRFGASTATEDEKDLSKVTLNLEMFEAYTKGFLAGTDSLLTNGEIELLPEGAKMMAVECGMRFLTDYLSGDTYFKTKYPEHNLDRCRTQLKFVSDMESKWDTMKQIVRKYKH